MGQGKMGRRGPKAKQGKREPGGRLSRQPKDVSQRNLVDLDVEQRATLSVGLDARERMFHVKPQHSRDQKAGSAVGRYCLQGLITQAQYDAAMAYLESYSRYLLAIDAPPQPGAVDLNATHGRPVGRENVSQLANWRRLHDQARRAVQEKQNEIRLMGNLFGAIDMVVVRNVELEHLLGDLRTALNALVKHYGLLARAA